jgi:hypothetical protein
MIGASCRKELDQDVLRHRGQVVPFCRGSPDFFRFRSTPVTIVIIEHAISIRVSWRISWPPYCVLSWPVANLRISPASTAAEARCRSFSDDQIEAALALSNSSCRTGSISPHTHPRGAGITISFWLRPRPRGVWLGTWPTSQSVWLSLLPAWLLTQPWPHLSVS